MNLAVNVQRASACRACRGRLSARLLDLGAQPLANGYLRSPRQHDPRFPLRVMICEDCSLAQLDHVVDARAIFEDYPYLSSVSSSWLAHARSFCSRMTERLDLNPHSFVLEIASNDGYLLRNFVAAGIPCLGVEPAGNVVDIARAAGVPTRRAFFGANEARAIAADHGLADLVVANNVLAHVPDVMGFVEGLARVLAPRGLLSIEVPHLLRLIEGHQFDTIYHEHYSYWSLAAAERVLGAQGLEIVAVEHLETHGGSLRMFAAHRGARAVESCVAATRELEIERGLFDGRLTTAFARSVARTLAEFKTFLGDARRRGLRVAAYGAAAKGNTFLNAAGIGAGDIIAVADASPTKIGAWLPGSHIPIVAPRELIAMAPDLIFILPWNISREIASALRDLGYRGPVWRAIPDLREVGARVDREIDIAA